MENKLKKLLLRLHFEYKVSQSAPYFPAFWASEYTTSNNGSLLLGLQKANSILKTFNKFKPLLYLKFRNPPEGFKSYLYFLLQSLTLTWERRAKFVPKVHFHRQNVYNPRSRKLFLTGILDHLCSVLNKKNVTP